MTSVAGAAGLVLVAATTCLPRLPALVAVGARERDDVALVHHVAVAVEHDTLVHHERRSDEVGLHARVATELDGVASLDLAVDLAVDHDGAAGDVVRDLGGAPAPVAPASSSILGSYAVLAAPPSSISGRTSAPWTTKREPPKPRRNWCGTIFFGSSSPA